MPTTPESYRFCINCQLCLRVCSNVIDQFEKFSFRYFQVYFITLKQTEKDKEKNGSVARDVENKEDDHQSNHHLHHNDQELERKSFKN